MNILTKYLLLKYLKYFLIILVSLQVFFVGIDFIQQFKDIPPSANLQLLYLFYNSFFTLTITLPLSLVFAWIVTITVLIKNNELVSFHSLGLSQWQILKPVVFISFFITFSLIMLQMTPLAYSYEEKKKIINNQYFSSEQENIFLKYNEYFIYFRKLYPLQKKAEDIHIYKIQNNSVIEIVTAKKAIYQNNKWYITDTKIVKKPENLEWNSSKLTITYEKFLDTLEGFEPKIINNVYKGDVQLSIIDAISAILLLDNQDFNTNKIKATLYSQIFVPLFIFPLMILIFIFISPSSRFFNTATFVSISIFITLCIWGVMFLLQKLALGGVVLSEVAIILPLITLYILTYYFYRQRV